MRRDWPIMALLAAATVAVFWRVSRHEFVNYDDPAYVTHNPMVQVGLTWEGVKWAFGELHGEATYWHPITWLSHMLDCQLFGLRPAGHHVTSLVLHALNTALLFGLLRRMTGRRGASAVVAALFALHPLQVDSVAWVAERKNLLSTCFGLLTLWAYARYAERRMTNDEGQMTKEGRMTNDPGREWSGKEGNRDRASRFTFDVSRPTSYAPFYYVLALGLFTLGLMSKPMLVPLPLAMLLLDYWPLGRLRSLEAAGDSPRSTGRSARSTVRSARSTVRSAQPTVGSPQPTVRSPQPTVRSARSTRRSLPSAVLSSFVIRASFVIRHSSFVILEKLPFLALSAASSLVTLRGHESLGALVSEQELPLAYRLANAVVAYASYLRKVVWPVDLSVFYLHPGRWPAGTVLVSAALLVGVTVLAAWQARRRPYLIVGWLWFLGMLVPMIGLVQAHVQALADRFAYMPIIGLFIMGVWAAADSWEGWPARRAVQASLGVLVLAGCALTSTLQLRYWRNSITLLQHAVDVEGRNFIARVMLGNAFFERGQLDPALREYQAAARLRPDYAEAWDHAGMVLTQQGKPGEAIPCFRKAIELAPGWPDPHRRLALALLHEGRKEEARAAYQQLPPLMPATAEGYRDLADMLNEGQQFADAIRYYREALRLQPDFPAVLNNLALLRAACPQPEFRDSAEAVQLAERGCQLTDRRDPNLLGTLATAYAQAGRFGDAVKAVEEAQAAAKAAGADYLLPLQAKALEKYRAGKTP
jgi:protein O-mannosyl-transferase